MCIRKGIACLVGGILLLWNATVLSVQPLEVKSVVVVYNADESIELMIYGENFMNGNDLELWLGEDIPLAVKEGTLTNTSVTAVVPPGDYEGSYQVLVTSGGGAVRINEFDGVTFGTQGPQGEQGPPGLDGAPGADGADGAPGADGTSCSAAQGAGSATVNCTDGTSATVYDGADGAPGADGSPGAPGAAGQSVVSVSLDVGDANCLYGGTQFTSASGVDYACNGAPGPQGLPGADGAPGIPVAGQSCPPDYPFVSGFSSDGDLFCVNAAGQLENPPLSESDPDIVFLFDYTADMQSSLAQIKSVTLQALIPELSATFPTIRFGVARFGDFPVDPYGEVGDFPFLGLQPLTDDSPSLIQAIQSVDAYGGGDIEEAGHEAFYQLATGEGINPYVPPFDMQFLPDRRTIVLAITSADFHESTDYPASFGAHSYEQAVAELSGRGIKVIGIALVRPESLAPKLELTAYAVDTDSLLPPDTFGLVNSCPTRIGGTEEPTLPSGLCPPVFEANRDTGAGVPTARIVEAIEGLVNSPNWNP
jgi:hypothetical protein